MMLILLYILIGISFSVYIYLSASDEVLYKNGPAVMWANLISIGLNWPIVLIVLLLDGLWLGLRAYKDRRKRGKNGQTHDTGR